MKNGTIHSWLSRDKHSRQPLWAVPHQKSGYDILTGLNNMIIDLPKSTEGKLTHDTDNNTKQQVIEKAYSLAHENEHLYGCCSQCVLAAIQEVMGIVDDATFKAAHGLAGGGALMTGGTCGALAGGMLAISSVYGRSREDFSNGQNVQLYKQSYKLSRQLYNRFVAEYGGPLCAVVQTDLMGRSFNMWDREDYAAFEGAGGHLDKCPSVTGNVAAWTVELLLDAQEKAEQPQK